MVLASCSFSRLSKEIENETHGGWWQQKTRTWNLHLLGDYIQMLFHSSQNLFTKRNGKGKRKKSL